MKKILIAILVSFCIVIAYAKSKPDPYIWLEDVTGKKAISWVKKINSKSTAEIEKVPGFKELNKELLNIYNSKDRIPYAEKKGEYVYNFWQDDHHPRGIYRRTTMEKYKKKNPEWEIILDIDSLAKKEKKNWVFKGTKQLYPDYNRALVFLSIGGKDAKVVREFDIFSKKFIKNGFYLPEAKSQIDWIDKNTVFVGTDFGKDSLTTSGYPRIVKIWKRGTPINEAKTIFKTNKNSIYASGIRYFSEQGNIDIVNEAITFYTNKNFVLIKGKLVDLQLPLDADIIGFFKKQAIIKLKSAFKVGAKRYKKGTVLIARVKDLVDQKKNFQVLIQPTSEMSIDKISITKNYILATVLKNVVNKLYCFTQDKTGQFHKKEISINSNGTLSVFNTNINTDDFFVKFSNFLTPTSLYQVTGKSGEKELLKNEPSWFDARPYEIEQKFAISRDGTKIPYFIVGSKNMKLDGSNPTLLYGYGGFMISLKPWYSATIGKAWLEKGGVFVLANIRGGGEYGPGWHQAALKNKRMKAYEDFIAVAEDLISQKITNPKKLGIKGGSNGGLLVGATFVLRPTLFNAVICQVPLLDMKRYTKLLAGASWIAEYGDPEKPQMWNYIKKYSPYHNVKKEVEYPEVFFSTSTKDDRVHPAHARKMVAKMINQGHKVFYYENIEGGHGGAANNKQYAYMYALEYSYLYMKLLIP